MSGGITLCGLVIHAPATLPTERKEVAEDDILVGIVVPGPNAVLPPALAGTGRVVPGPT